MYRYRCMNCFKEFYSENDAEIKCQTCNRSFTLFKIGGDIVVPADAVIKTADVKPTAATVVIKTADTPVTAGTVVVKAADVPLTAATITPTAGTTVAPADADSKGGTSDKQEKGDDKSDDGGSKSGGKAPKEK